MRTIFAEYNPQCNSIDVYTSAGYMLRIDCWEAEKNLKTTPESDCALNALAIDDPLEYARLYLDEKGTNVRKIAKATGISATTLYSIIQKDSNIRFDFALRLANELQIDVNEICSASPFSGTIKEEEIYPTLPDGLNGALDASRVKTYLKNSMYPLMYLFGKNSMPDVDNLLTSFYQLDDESRQEVVETIRLKLQYHRDPERAEQIKQIKGW